MQRNPYNPFIIAHSTRSKDLEAKYNLFNELYFNGKLPKYRVFLCPKSKPFGHEVAGYCLSDNRKILIRNGMGRRSTLQTLVHEMVHAELTAQQKDHNVHGREFVEELRRLRKAGAPLSPLDIDNQTRKEARLRHLLTKRSIGKLIEEAILVEGISKKEVPKFLERELSLPRSIIDSAVDVRALTDLMLSHQVSIKRKS